MFRRPPEEAPNQPRELPLAELAVAVGLWRQILESIESAAEELRDSGHDPAEVLDQAGVQLTGAHAMRVTMGSAVAELLDVADPAGEEGVL